MSQPASNRRVGQIMLFLAWLAGMFLAVQWFSGVEQRQRNPNMQVDSLRQNEVIEVRLRANRQGHYLASGLINGQPVTFLLDTGATFVAVPASLGPVLGLQPGRRTLVNTANGQTDSFTTRIDSLVLGDIRLQGVDAGLVPGMAGDEVLLGMSALRQLEFSQQGGELILRHWR
ncbi:MAG: TIGR02281 family clan AA aspartic protease [Halopseudomonas yangmingensis]